MEFLKVMEDDGREEYIRLDKILAIKPLANGKVKILMGAGLYWNVLPESMELVGGFDNVFKAVMEVYDK